MPVYKRGTTKTDVVVLKESTYYYADAGHDLVVGSQENDSINGSDGLDLLFGRGGKDVITGGKGLDFLMGNDGNDTFAFVAGDLIKKTGLFNGYLGLVDTILDFHGAGGYKAHLGVEDDFLQFRGFGVGSTIEFVKTVGSASSQLYYIDDTTGKNSGYILINMADGKNKLAAGDYAFLDPITV